MLAMEHHRGVCRRPPLPLRPLCGGSKTLTPMIKTKIKILSFIVPTVFILDQITKKLIVKFLPQGFSVPVIPGFFDIVHVRNRGAAFGFMSNLPDSIRLPVFFCVSLLALGMVLVYFFKTEDTRKMTLISLALILGGAAGNICDRIVLGEGNLKRNQHLHAANCCVYGQFMRILDELSTPLVRDCVLDQPTAEPSHNRTSRLTKSISMPDLTK